MATHMDLPADYRRIKELEEALRFYADSDNYVCHEWQSNVDWDKGERARAALYGKE